MTAGTISLALKTAQSGLMATQTALSTVSQNITNVNTPGYSRKTLHLEERVLAGVGAGVQVAGVERAVDAGLLKDIVRETSDLHTLAIKTDYFQRLETAFGQPAANSSIAHTISSLKSAFDSLAASPQSSLAQSEALRWAENVANQLAEMSATIQELRLQADTELASQTDRANELIIDIADMNDKIIRNDAVGNDVSDLLDRRDQNLIELSSIIDIQYFERSSGEVAVFTKSGTVLVDNDAQPISHRAASAVSATTTHSEGDFTGIYVGLEVTNNDITNDLISGDIKGLVELRDETLYNMQRELDELADKLSTTINQIHNRGVAYPGAQSMNGTRYFIDASQQTMTLGTNDDVRFILFDSSGSQSATVTLDTIMQDAAYGTGAQPTGGPWTIEEVRSSMEDWLQANAGAQASITFSEGGTSGKMQIDLGTANFNFAIRDEGTRNTAGAAHEDASITFNPTGVAGQVTETVNGFSSFLGLNDVYVDNAVRTTWESKIMDSSFRSSGATLMFYDSDTGIGAGNEIPTGGLTIFAGSTLQEIADAINASTGLNKSFQATVVNEGAGQRLRITNSNGNESYIATASGQSLLSDIGLQESNIGLSTVLKIRPDLLSTPGKFASAQVQYDSTLGASGEYYVSTGDNANITAIASAFNDPIAFEKAGASVVTSSSLENFATQILSRTASTVANNESDQDLQFATVDSLNFKLDSIKGVNLDEEMASLILYEQAYGASARVITVIQDMFDTLENAIR